MTQPEEDDPLKDKYGDAPMVQSREVCSRPYTDIGVLDASWDAKEVGACMQAVSTLCLSMGDWSCKIGAIVYPDALMV